MARRTFAGEEIASVLASHGFVPVDRTGSHLKLRWESSTDDEVRVVTVPLVDDIPTGTLRAIAEQSGAKDFDAWCAWIDENA